METKLEEMSQANVRLRDELRDAKDMMSAIDLNPLPPAENNSGMCINCIQY